MPRRLEGKESATEVSGKLAVIDEAGETASSGSDMAVVVKIGVVELDFKDDW